MRSFADDLEKHAHRVALIAGDGETLTYTDLAARADDFATGLTGTGPLLLEASNATEAIVAYLACLRRRRPVILAEPVSTTRDERIVRTFRPALLYRQTGSHWHLESLAGNNIQSHPDLAVLLSTSGTTGSPKLVRLSHENLNSNARAIAQYLALDATQRAITSLPFFYSYGMSVVNSYLSVGASLVLTDGSVTDHGFWELVDYHHVTSLAGVPFTYELLEQIGFRDRAPASLQILTQAGGRLPPPLASAYAQWAADRGIRFFVMYGQTEAAPRMAYMPPELLAAHPNHIGLPIPDGRFRIVDDSGQEALAGEAGELVYAGPNVMMGYAERTEDLALPKTCHELFTGDLAVRDDGGLYRIVGRKGRFAKPFGFRIALDEVEAVLQDNGIIAAAASTDARVDLCIAHGDAAVAVNLLANRYRVPAHAFAACTVDELPRLPSGKIDYAAVIARTDAAIGAGPAAESNHNIATVMSSAFNRAVSPEDSFASLGGDSLSYVQVTMEIERLLGHVPQGWEDLPISKLEHLRSTKAPNSSTRWWPTIDTEIIVRACAICSVVISHTTPWAAPAPGGALVLLMLAGYSFARFSGDRLAQGKILPILGQFALHIIVPYYLVYVALVLFTKQSHFNAAGLFLFLNAHKNTDRVASYWFIHALFQCILLFIVPFLFARFRQFSVEWPWKTATLILAVALAIKLTGALIWNQELLENHTLDANFYIFVFGWVFFHAKTDAQKSAVFALMIIVTGLDYSITNTRHIWMATAFAAILLIPRIGIPRPAYLILSSVASASFYIFLTHEFAIQIVRYEIGLKSYAATVMGAAILGVTVERLVSLLRGWIHSRREQNVPENQLLKSHKTANV